VAVLLVEQDVEVALSLAARAYVLETGRVVAQGAAADLRDDPAVREAYLGG
jgi:branched-chain amino acid transport system ATP-binding protein